MLTPAHSLLEIWRINAVEIDESQLPAAKRLTMVFRDASGNEALRLIVFTETAKPIITTTPALAIDATGPMKVSADAPLGSMVAGLTLFDQVAGAAIPATFTLSNDAGGQFAIADAELVTNATPLVAGNYTVTVVGTTNDNPKLSAALTIAM